MITKKEELEIITATIGQLGEKSYLGPWLLSIRHELEAMMRADSFPCINLTEAKEDALKIVKEGERQADLLRVAANQRAEDRATMTERETQRARTLIREATNALGAIEERL
tara:strand:+ start:534 stop:866 length:333 start_codon:yes stop_codon:yes gene_type:complete